MQSPKIEFECDYYEYECGNNCSVNGCDGHVTDIPISITLDGITFYVSGYPEGDFPNSNSDAVKSVVEKLKTLLK